MGALKETRGSEGRKLQKGKRYRLAPDRTQPQPVHSFPPSPRTPRRAWLAGSLQSRLCFRFGQTRANGLPQHRNPSGTNQPLVAGRPWRLRAGLLQRAGGKSRQIQS